MKKALLLFLLVTSFTLTGNTQESYGNTANIGIGLGHRNVYRASFPIIHFNYEFDVIEDITLAPFITLVHYRYINKWNGKKYRYNSWTIPIGLKGSYYFDDFLNLDSKFDIYGGGSIGFNIFTGGWNDGAYDGPDYDGGFSQLYLDINIGAEFHLNSKIGLILDLSTGISTFGISIHQ